jgi:hypothetical protein
VENRWSLAQKLAGSAARDDPQGFGDSTNSISKRHLTSPDLAIAIWILRQMLGVIFLGVKGLSGTGVAVIEPHPLDHPTGQLSGRHSGRPRSAVDL